MTLISLLTAQPRARPCPGEASRRKALFTQVPGVLGRGGLASEAEHLLTDTRPSLKMKGWNGGRMGSQEEKAEFKESGYGVSDS